MMARYQSLAQRLRSDMEELERTQAAVRRHWRGFGSADADPDAYLNSVAFNLHGLYCGLERMFELIAIELDGGTLGGERWHSELLNQMALDLPKVRPPRAGQSHCDASRRVPQIPPSGAQYLRHQPRS